MLRVQHQECRTGWHVRAGLGTDEARTFKPDPRAYQLGVDALKVKREEILFVAFAGWDAAGAKLFGYPTYLGQSTTRSS